MTQTYRVIDMHTAGEPVRIVVDGYPALAGATILDKRRDALEHHDHVRRLLMLEPRGHAEMYGAILVPPSTPGAALGVLFCHHEGYSTMCGHATIALGRFAVDRGLVPAAAPVARFGLECPCGVVAVTVAIDPDGRPGEVSFDSVPAFVLARDLEVSVAGLGTVRLDIAYGGAFYAILPASRIGHALVGAPIAPLRDAACRITEAIRATVPILVASGRLDDSVAESFQQLGVHLRLDKPFTAPQFAELLSAALKGPTNGDAGGGTKRPATRPRSAPGGPQQLQIFPHA